MKLKKMASCAVAGTNYIIAKNSNVEIDSAVRLAATARGRTF